MESVMISIRPKWCELITSGKKTIEVRKTRPKLGTPFKCYIYQTKQGKVPTGLFTEHGEIWGSSIKNGKVIGEFVCDKILPLSVQYSDPSSRVARKEFPYTCLNNKKIMDYLGNGKQGYGWHISDLVIYDRPREIGEFVSGSSRLEFSDTDSGFPWRLSGMTRPPQSWCYVNGRAEAGDMPCAGGGEDG